MDFLDFLEIMPLARSRRTAHVEACRLVESTRYAEDDVKLDGISRRRESSKLDLEVRCCTKAASEPGQLSGSHCDSVIRITNLYVFDVQQLSGEIGCSPRAKPRALVAPGTHCADSDRERCCSGQVGRCFVGFSLQKLETSQVQLRAFSTSSDVFQGLAELC